MHISSRFSRRAFTLIELMVVIAILALLMGILFPALSSSIRSAKSSKATTEAKQIAEAVEMFYDEYAYMPVPRDDQGYRAGPGDGDFGLEQVQPFTPEESRRIIQTLMAVDEGYNNNDRLNPKKIIFLDMPEAELSGEILDPWGIQYHIKLDRDFNNRVEFMSDPDQYRARVIVASPGPDGEFFGDENEEDNITNVELQ